MTNKIIIILCEYHKFMVICMLKCRCIYGLGDGTVVPNKYILISIHLKYSNYKFIFVRTNTLTLAIRYDYHCHFHSGSAAPTININIVSNNALHKYIYFRYTLSKHQFREYRVNN